MACGIEALDGLGGCVPSVAVTPFWYLDAVNNAVTGSKTVTVTCDPTTITIVYRDDAGVIMPTPPQQITVGYYVPVDPIPDTITIVGKDCAGANVNVTALDGRVVRTVPDPTSVQPTKDCNSDAILAAVDGIEGLIGTTNTNTGASNTALTTVNTNLTTIIGRLPAATTPGLLPVNALASIGVPRAQATSGVAAGIVLTTTCRRVSMFATTGTWYSVSGVATNASHYIAAGERLDFNVDASTTISVLQETSAGSIRVSELT